MKFLLAMISAALCLSAGIVCGQEPPLPAKSETPLPTPTPTPFTRPQLNIPEIPIPVEPQAARPESFHHDPVSRAEFGGPGQGGDSLVPA